MINTKTFPLFEKRILKHFTAIFFYDALSLQDEGFQAVMKHIQIT